MDYTDADDGRMYVSSDEKKFINRILRLKENYPDDVEIIKLPEENDGCVYATVPIKWLKLSPPRVNNMTESQRQEIAERLASYRKKKE